MTTADRNRGVNHGNPCVNRALDRTTRDELGGGLEDVAALGCVDRRAAVERNTKRIDHASEKRRPEGDGGQSAEPPHSVAGHDAAGSGEKDDANLSSSELVSHSDSARIECDELLVPDVVEAPHAGNAVAHRAHDPPRGEGIFNS